MPSASPNPDAAFEHELEALLEPGRFIPYGAMFRFTEPLDQLTHELGELISSDPASAFRRTRLMIAACLLRTEEMDDSGGNFGMLMDNLFATWARAGVASGADPDLLARQILAFGDQDQTGYVSGFDRSLRGTLDEATLRALLQLLEGRELSAVPRRDTALLRMVCVELGLMERLIALCEKPGLTQEDALEIARLAVAAGRPGDALRWVERGLGLKSGIGGSSLGALRRLLLRELGRGAEALQDAWTQFTEYPSWIS
jgi:hypothetical protein